MRYMFYWIRRLVQQKELRREIREYLEWRTQRYPTTTEGHQEYLFRFALYCGKNGVKYLEEEDVTNFVNGFNGEYQRREAAKVVYSFLAFHGVGDLHEAENSAKMIVMKKLGRPAHLERIQKVKMLKNVNRLSFRAIKEKFEKEERRPFYISQIHKWYHYPLPAGKDLTKENAQ